MQDHITYTVVGTTPDGTLITELAPLASRAPAPGPADADGHGSVQTNAAPRTGLLAALQAWYEPDRYACGVPVYENRRISPTALPLLMQAALTLLVVAFIVAAIML